MDFFYKKKYLCAYNNIIMTQNKVSKYLNTIKVT